MPRPGPGLRVLALVLALLPPPAAADEAQWLAQGRAAVERKDHAEALRWLAQAHAARVARLGERAAETIALAYELADASIEADRLADAEPLLKLVAEVRTQDPGLAHRDTQQALDDYAWVVMRRGRPREAVPWFERALQGHRARGGAPDQAMLQTMNNLATAYSAAGDIEQALRLGDEVVAGRTALLGPVDPATLRARNNRSHYLGQLGRLPEMLQVQRAIVADYRATVGERHRGALTAMNNEAAALQQLDRLAEALALHERVLTLRREVLGPRDRDVLQSLNNLAVLTADLGRREEALSMAQSAARLAVELLGERHPTSLTLLNNEATALKDAGRNAESLALLERVLGLRSEVLGERHADVVEAQHNRAELLGLVGRAAEQVEAYGQVLARRRALHGDRHALTIVALGNLASAQRRQGQTAEAVALQRQALALADEVLGPGHGTTLNLVDGLIRSLVADRQPDAAAELTERYVQGVEALRAQPGLSVANRQSLFRRHAAAYRLLARLHLRAGRLAEAWRLVELGKARTLLEGLGQQRAARAGVLPEADADRLEELSRRAAAADVRVAQAPDAQAREQLERQRNERARELQSLQAELRRRHPKFDQLSEIRLVAAAELPALVPAGQRALSYIVEGDEVAALVVGNDGVLVAQDLGELPGLAELTTLARQSIASPGGLAEALRSADRRLWRLPDGALRLLPAAAAPPAGARALVDGAEFRRALAARLLDPLAPALGAASGWIVVPDGPLAQLPFEALPWGPQGRPLAAAVDLRYAPSMSVYRIGQALATQYQSQARPRALFAMGRAQYQAGPGAPARQGTELLREVSDLRELDGQWADLPGTEAEVRGAAERFPGLSRLALGVEATEDRLIALDRLGELRRYRYLLFAAHGYVAPSRPDLSAVVLGLRHREPGTDGYVTAAEWTGYDLRSDLIVLSACETAAGPVVTGEGVMGLPFGLLVAGNVNTLLTLWPVDDRATAHFVTRLFDHLANGTAPARALADTRREMMRHPSWSHPRFWAPFILVGPG